MTTVNSDPKHFIDLEDTASKLQVDPLTLRAEYIDQVSRFLDQLRRGCGALHADYLHVESSNKLEPLLSGFLARRMERG